MLACVTTKNAPRCDDLVNTLCDCCATQVGRLRMPAPLLMKHKQIFWLRDRDRASLLITSDPGAVSTNRFARLA